MVILGMFMVLMVGGIVWTVQQMGRRSAVRVAALTIVGLLFAYEVRSSIVASFRNGDVPREMMVYTQSSPVVPEVAQRIIRLGRDQTAFSDRNTADLTGGYGMDIALDAGDASSGRSTGTSAIRKS